MEPATYLRDVPEPKHDHRGGPEFILTTTNSYKKKKKVPRYLLARLMVLYSAVGDVAYNTQSVGKDTLLVYVSHFLSSGLKRAMSALVESTKTDCSYTLVAAVTVLLRPEVWGAILSFPAQSLRSASY